MFIGSNAKSSYLDSFLASTNISDAGIITINQKNSSATLKILSGSKRQEFFYDAFPPLSMEMIKPYLNCDLLIINMVSGWDIHLDTLRSIRSVYDGIICLDLHSLVTKVNADGSRTAQKPDEFENWIQMADIIQMNENEFNTLNSSNLSLQEFFLNYCISKKKLINLTLSEKGSNTIYFSDWKIQNINHKAETFAGEFESTGCGDAFMAGFVYGLLTNHTKKNCVKLANRIAAINGYYKGLPDLYELKLKLKTECIT